MNLIKNSKAPAQEKKLSLDVFKDKMIGEVSQEKGGSSAICTSIGITIGIELAEWILDSCHD